MNSGTAGTASAYGEAEPFRAPARAFGSPYKFIPKGSRSKVVQGSQRKKQKPKDVRLNCPLRSQPIDNLDVDDLIRGLGRLTLADDPVQTSLPADDGFNISLAAAPRRSSSIFSLPHAVTAWIDHEAGKEKQIAVEVVDEDVTAISIHIPHSRPPRDDTPLASLGSLESSYSPRFLNSSIRTTPVRPSNIPTATTTSSTGPPSASRPCLTAIAVSLVYEVYACLDGDEADEVQTWYPIGGGTVDVAATGRGLTLGATVEV